MNTELISIQEAVRNQIRETVMNAVPKESIDKLVKDYFEGEFKTFVKEELKKSLAERFTNEINRQAGYIWDNYGRRTMADVSNEVAKSIMDGFAQSIMSSVLGTIQNNARIY